MNKKITDNEKLAHQIYNQQMVKLQGKIIEKKLTKNLSKNQFESQSQNISNNNSPVVGRQKSYENLQKVNRTFAQTNVQVSQQKLSSILNVMAGQQIKQKYSLNNELMDTVKISKLKRNQSMIQIDQQSPPLTKNGSFHRPNSSVKNKLNSNSVSTENQQIQKIKDKLKMLLQERDKLGQDVKEVQFMTKFNQTLNQLLTVLFSDNLSSMGQQPSSTQDTFQALQIDHFFKRQIQIVQLSYQQTQEKKKLENILAQIKKKQEQIILENHNLTQLKIQQQEQITSLKQQIHDYSNSKQDSESQELKFLVQGQFEAIQKLLQREQLMKVFLKRVGDNSIIEMFEQFIVNAEYVNQDDTEGNLNINLLPNNKSFTKQKISKQPDEILTKFESPYRQLNLCDSLFADDSRVNESEESSFGYMGKEQATEISCYFGQGRESQSQKMHNIRLNKEIKDRLKINMMDVQLIQAAQKHESKKHNQKILPDDFS